MKDYQQKQKTIYELSKEVEFYTKLHAKMKEELEQEKKFKVLMEQDFTDKLTNSNENISKYKCTIGSLQLELDKKAAVN